MVTTITIVLRRFFISRLSCCNLSDFTEVHVALTLLLQSYLLTSGLNVPVWMHMSPVSSLHWSPSLPPAVLWDCSIWPPPTLSTSYQLQYPRPPIIFTNAPKSMQGFLADHLIHLSSPKDPFLLSQAHHAMHHFYSLSPLSPLLVLLGSHTALCIFVRFLKNLLSCVNWVVCSKLPSLAHHNKW